MRRAADPERPDARLPSRGPGWWRLRELASAEQRVRARSNFELLALWTAAIAGSIAFGVANVELGWNAMELELFGLPFEVTLYPPFLVSVLLALWIGPTWGAVPIYFANLASALASGLPLSISALFALAGAAETLVLWGALVALRVDPELRRGRDLGGFVAAGFVAAVTGSLAAVLWNAGHALDVAQGHRVYRGWVLGDLLQLVVLVAPVLALGGRRARAWVDHRFVSPPRHDFRSIHGVAFGIAIFVILAGLVFVGVWATIDAVAASAEPEVVSRFREVALAVGLLAVAFVAATAIFSTALARIGERERLEARLDPLTGCLVRRAFAEEFAREAERSRRLGLGLGILFVDLDRFKAINDGFGHDAGDLALCEVVRRIEGQLRQTDLLARWGGEELVALLPHTAASEVESAAERIRLAVRATPLAALGGSGHATVSIGVASALELPVELEALLARADAACYRAKREGRDRVVVAGDDDAATIRSV